VVLVKRSTHSDDRAIRPICPIGNREAKEYTEAREIEKGSWKESKEGDFNNGA
jgi:hypothetical protein